ncbi:MAG TPA: ParB/RepB/Spo0J family partition protein [Dehalococcoidia bacterium]|nr:ParB/RepB/Spo0J family partition protein [Dehalococcoidia bacterium]
MDERGEFRLVNLAEILLGEYVVRTVDEDPGLPGLARSIAADGLMNPLTLEERPEGLVLVSGHRRYSACLMARLAEVPCRVYPAGQAKMIRMAFVENHHRKDVTPLEQAHRIGQVLDAGTMTVEEVAETFGRRVEWVEEQLAMLEWPGDVQEAVHLRQVSVAAGQHLAKIQDDSYRIFLVRMAVENGCTERTAISWVAGWRASVPAEQVAAAGAAAGPERPGAIIPLQICLACHQPREPSALAVAYLCVPCVVALREGRPVG